MFSFQMNASYLINEYLQDNNLCIISGKKGVGKKYIIENMEFDYDRYPIIENAYTVKDFYSQLLVFKNESNNTDLEIGIGSSIQTNIPITQILNKFRNFIKLDFDNLDNKVTNELDMLAKKNNLLLPIQLYKNTSNNLLNLIFNRLINLDIKILIVINEEDIIYLKEKLDFDSIPNVIVDYKIEDICFEFEDSLSKNDIERILSLTSGEIKYVIEIHNYLQTNPQTNFTDYTRLKISHIQDSNNDAYSLLEFLSYFEDDFSRNEIKYIYNRLYDEFKISSELNILLKYIIENHILEEDNSFYRFILSIFKQILKQNKTDNKKFNKVLGDCIKEIYPLDLDAQLYYYSKADNKYSNIVKWFIVIRLARDKNLDDETLSIIDTIEENHIKRMAIIMVDAYKCFYESNYDKVLNVLSEISISEDSKFSNEVNYLTALCYWKKSDEFKSDAYKLLEAIISDPNTFEETILLSKMALLSIYSNDAQYHNTNILKLYNELKNYINERIIDDKDYNLLLNILRRKSNCVFPSKQCINDLKNSFDYFNEYKNVFSQEFAMSLCNYCAALLNLGEFDKCLDCYKDINWKSLNDSYKLYNYNNYLLSEFFSNKTIISDNIVNDINKYELLLNAYQMSIDTRILTYINLAGLKIYEGKYNEAEEIYKTAEKLNNDYDDYFSYLINMNKCVIAIINNDYANAEILFNRMNYIPDLFSVYDKQYLRKRNEVLFKVIKNRKPNLTINDISKSINKELYDEFITNNAKFFSTAILFSDIQFWTDN